MKYICIALVFFAISSLRAQTVSVTYSDKFELRDHGLTEKEGSTFWSGDYFYCVETVYKGVQLAYTAKLDNVKYDVNLYQYDRSMKELKHVTLGGSDHFGPFPPFTAFFGGKVLIFYYRVQPDKSIQLLYSAVDPETLTSEPGKLLYTISERNVGIFNLRKAFYLNELRGAISPDSSKLLVAQAGNTDEIFTCVLDNNGITSKPAISKIRGDLEEFNLQQAHIDNEGNRYFTFYYSEDKKWKSGIFLRNAAGKEAWPAVNTMQDGLEAGTIFMQESKDNTKMYLYGLCDADNHEEGVFLTTVDGTKLKLGKPAVYLYPEDIGKNLHKLDYGEKHHGAYTVKPTYYACTELSDGTIALTGYPINVIHHSYTNNVGVMAGNTTNSTEHFAGPLLNIFFKNGKGSMGVIYRDQEMTAASAFITVPYGDKLVCIYNDSEKSLGSDDLRVNGRRYEIGDLVLAYAVIGSDGTVISRKKVADKDGHLSFFTQYQQNIGDNNFLVPLCEYKMNAIRYYTEMKLWAKIKVI